MSLHPKHLFLHTQTHSLTPTQWRSAVRRRRQWWGGLVKTDRGLLVQSGQAGDQSITPRSVQVRYPNTQQPPHRPLFLNHRAQKRARGMGQPMIDSWRLISIDHVIQTFSVLPRQKHPLTQHQHALAALTFSGQSTGPVTPTEKKRKTRRRDVRAAIQTRIRCLDLFS